MISRVNEILETIERPFKIFLFLEGRLRSHSYLLRTFSIASHQSPLLFTTRPSLSLFQPSHRLPMFSLPDLCGWTLWLCPIPLSQSLTTLLSTVILSLLILSLYLIRLLEWIAEVTIIFWRFRKEHRKLFSIGFRRGPIWRMRFKF